MEIDGFPVLPATAVHPDAAQRDANLTALRDWFAGMATEQDVVVQMELHNGQGQISNVCARYRHADRMLAERAKKDDADG